MHSILIVDDHPEINQVLAIGLRLEGYSVVQAHNGAAALSLAAEMLPDLILLDIMMPDMSGIQVAEILQTPPETRHIPIIFVTSRSEAEERAAALAMPGVVDYICKPFTLQELL